MAEINQYRMQRDKEFRLKQSKVSKKVSTAFLCGVDYNTLIFKRCNAEYQGGKIQRIEQTQFN